MNMRWRWIEISSKPMHFIGLGKIYIGRAEETEVHIGEALRLSPRDTMAYLWLNIAGIAKNHLGLWEQSVARFRRALEANRNFPSANFNLAAALAQLGRTRRGAFRGNRRSRAEPVLRRLPHPSSLGRR